jgi:hypothetical protein
MAETVEKTERAAAGAGETGRCVRNGMTAASRKAR